MSQVMETLVNRDPHRHGPGRRPVGEPTAGGLLSPPGPRPRCQPVTRPAPPGLRAMARGRSRRVRDPGCAPGWERRQAAACLAAGPGAVLSHRAAAALHGFPDCWQGAPEIAVPWTIATPPRARSYPPGHLPGVDRRDRRKGHSRHQEASHGARLGRGGLAPDARRHSGRPGRRPRPRPRPRPRRGDHGRRRLRPSGKKGSTALRQVLAERGPGYVPPEGELERRLLTVLRVGGLPAPVRQHPLPALAGSGRVDVAYPCRRLLIEGDGRRWHTNPASTKADRSRDNEAAALGWRALRFGWDDLLPRPDRVCQVVRCSLSVPPNP